MHYFLLCYYYTYYGFSHVLLPLYHINPVMAIISNYFHYGNYINNIMTISFTSDMAFNHLYLAVVPDDDHGRISEEEEQQTPRSQTPPTPDHHQSSPSPPRPIR